jgi:hypothetical protein
MMYCAARRRVSELHSGNGARAQTNLFRHAPAELPANARLHGEHDVVHLELVRVSGMLGVHERVREHLRGVALRELEQLVQDGGLGVGDARRGGEDERDVARAGRDVGRGVGGARHVRMM